MLKLLATQLSWVNGQVDDPTDQCAHGQVTLSVGDDLLIGPGDADLTVSACGLYLLRTLEDDHLPDQPVSEGNWLFPCCGFNVFPDHGRYKVACMGCNTGTDVFVRHEGESVTLVKDDQSHTISRAQWTSAVLGFVEQVEAFYAASTVKVALDDERDREGWRLFWNEWNERKARATQSWTDGAPNGPK